jgi:sulfatase maturation enzyme AslB (radical SAM superfamily)
MLARDVAHYEDLLDPGVRTVHLMLTTACNFRCAYCEQQRRASRQMSPDVLDAAIRRLVSSRLDRPTLTFFGGEPLLAAPLIRRALDRVREWAPPRMKPDIRIVTNGSRLDEEMTRLLVSRDVFITLSFDGVAPAQDDRSPESFEPLDRLLVRLRRDHPRHFQKRLAVMATLTSRNVPFLSASFRYFLSRFVRDVRVVPVLPDDAGWGARVARELDRQLAVVVELSIEEFRRSGEIPFRRFRGAASKPPADGAPACVCGSRGLLFVDVDGTLAPCSSFAPSTFGGKPRPLQRVLAALGGLHVADPNLPAALVARERHARRLRFLAGPADRQGPRGACARCRDRPSCFVCPEAVACNGGRIPAFHCDVNRLFARHRGAFHRQTA